MATACKIRITEDNIVRNVLFLAPGYQYAQTVVKNLSNELDRAKIPYNASNDPQNFYIHTDKVHVEIIYLDPVRYTFPLFQHRDAIFGKKELVDKVYDAYRHSLFGRPNISLSKYIREAHKDPDSEDFPQRTTYIPGIKNVHFNDPMTIVIWEDGTKTIVKCQEGDVFSKEAGLAMCITKKAFGNTSNFNNVFKKWIPEEEVKQMPDVFTVKPLTVFSATSTLSEEIRAAGEKLLQDIRDSFEKHNNRQRGLR